MGRVVISLHATVKAGGKREGGGCEGVAENRGARGVLSELASWAPEAGRCRRRIIAGR